MIRVLRYIVFTFYLTIVMVASGEILPAEATSYDKAAVVSDAKVKAETFKVGLPNKSYLDFTINENKQTVTLTKCQINGIEELIIPRIVECDGIHYRVQEIAPFTFATVFEDKAPLKGVKSVIIPDGVERIGQNAFEGAPDLEEVSLPSTLHSISYMMFSKCRRLKKVEFSGLPNLYEIDNFAFADCAMLQSFTIPKNVEKIGMAPWRNCELLTEIKLDEENYNFRVEDGVLYSADYETLIQYPAGCETKEYNVIFGTKTIGNSAFYGSYYLEKVVFPASLESISHLAFYECRHLREVVFNGFVKVIGNSAFRGCASLNEMVIYGEPKFNLDLDMDTYDSFEPYTSLKFERELPPIVLPESSAGILGAVYDYVSKMPYFFEQPIKKNKDYGFPSEFGKGKMTGFGNAGPKEDVLRVLEAIPDNYLVKKFSSPSGKINRFYVDKTDPKHPKVLYFFGGVGGNDLVVCLFENGNLKKIERYIDGLVID